MTLSDILYGMHSELAEDNAAAAKRQDYRDAAALLEMLQRRGLSDVCMMLSAACKNMDTEREKWWHIAADEFAAMARDLDMPSLEQAQEAAANTAHFDDQAKRAEMLAPYVRGRK